MLLPEAGGTSTSQGDEMEHGSAIERDVEQVEQRKRLQTRHAEALVRLMETRRDLRGVHALADFVADAVRWSA